MPLLSLPNELLIESAKYLDPKTYNSFLRTSRLLASLLGPGRHALATQDELKTNPLIWASLKGHIPLVRYLLAKRFDPNTESDSLSQIHYAARSDSANEPLARLLLENGARADSHDKEGYTTLQHAAMSHNFHPFCKAKLVMETLFEYGADVNKRSIALFQTSALHVAIRVGIPQTVMFLLEKGADVILGDWNQLTPLHAAAGELNLPWGNKFTLLNIGILLDHGADIDARDCYGSTPLFKAVALSDKDAVKLLIDRKANYAIKGWGGHTPFEYAKFSGGRFLDIVELLKGVSSGYEQTDT